MNETDTTEPREIDILTDADVERLIEATQSPDTFLGARTRVMVRLLFNVGLRVTSACKLPLKHVDLKEGEIHVQRGAKRKKKHAVGADPQTCAEIARFIPIRHAFLVKHGIINPSQHGDNLPVLCTRTGKPMCRRNAHRRLLSLAVLADLTERRIHPHGLRHSHTAKLVHMGWAVHEIQQQLGHASLHATAHYVPTVSAAHLAAKFRGTREDRYTALERLYEALCIERANGYPNTERLVDDILTRRITR